MRRKPKNTYIQVFLVLLILTSVTWVWYSIHRTVIVVDSPSTLISLTTRHRNIDTGALIYRRVILETARTAAIVMDMWDKHCCEPAEQRAVVLAPFINETINNMRKRGIHIIHSPSNVVEHYRGTIPREKARRFKDTILPTEPMKIDEKRELVAKLNPPITVDNNPVNTCNCKPPYTRRTKQLEEVAINEKDVILDSAHELFGYLKTNDITTVIYLGINLNICVLWRRDVALVQVQKWGFSTILVRDMTDVISETDNLGIPHDKKNELMVQHIEKYWSETVDAIQFSLP